MGFGLLFLGYFFTFFASNNPFGSFILPLGIVLMLIAFLNLNKYCHKFFLCTIPLAIIGIGGIYKLISDISEIFALNLKIVTNVAYEIFDWIQFSGTVLFHITLMIAIINIAKNVGLMKIVSKSIRNFFIFSIYAVIYIVSSLPLSTAVEFRKIMTIPYLVVNVLWIILNLMMIFSCYMRICPEGDENMPDKPSKFKLINKMNDAINKQHNKTYESQKQYYMEKALSKSNKKSKKGK